MLFLSVTEGDDTGALDSVAATAVVVAPDPRANTALTCTFCPASFPRMAGCNEARVVTRKSDDGGRAFLPAPKRAVELVFLPSQRRTTGDACCAGDCHGLVTSRVGAAIATVSARC
jgi:hypothetical protein